jgi:hypothetical protein
MFWAYRPPSYTFPTMSLEASFTVSARRLKVQFLITNPPISRPGNLSQL